MTIAVLATDQLKQEFEERKFAGEVEVMYADSMRALQILEADAYFDLMFEYDPERIRLLRKFFPKPVVVNSIVFTAGELGEGFIRINGWPTMLKRAVAEVACAGESVATATALFQDLGWQIQIVPDATGMVTPRIVAMIINEAAYALGEGISTKEEIDLAMKMGTNYPFGPFEWLELIGRERVTELLKELNRASERYSIAPLLLGGNV